MRRLSSMMAATSSAKGPLGPGLRRGEEIKEKRRRYFRATRALVELKHRSRLDQPPEPQEPVWPYEQRSQAENETIEGGEIERSLPGAMADSAADA